MHVCFSRFLCGRFCNYLYSRGDEVNEVSLNIVDSKSKFTLEVKTRTLAGEVFANVSENPHPLARFPNLANVKVIMGFTIFR